MVVVWGEGQEVGGKEGAGPAALRYFTKTISGPGLVSEVGASGEREALGLRRCDWHRA